MEQSTFKEYILPIYPQIPGYKDSQTSKAAAESLNKDKIRDIHRSIMNIIPDGKTTEEIIDIMWGFNDPHYNQNTFRLYAKEYHAHATYIKPRVTEMLRLGMIYDSGLRRDTFGGHSSKVWIKV